MNILMFAGSRRALHNWFDAWKYDNPGVIEKHSQVHMETTLRSGVTLVWRAAESGIEPLRGIRVNMLIVNDAYDEAAVVRDVLSPAVDQVRLRVR